MPRRKMPCGCPVFGLTVPFHEDSPADQSFGALMRYIFQPRSNPDWPLWDKEHKVFVFPEDSLWADDERDDVIHAPCDEGIKADWITDEDWRVQYV